MEKRGGTKTRIKKNLLFLILRLMSQSISVGDVATTTGDDLDANIDGSVDSNDEYQRSGTNYEKGKLRFSYGI